MTKTGRMLCAVAVALVVGCSSGDPGGRNPDYDAARELWTRANVRDYRFTLRTLCNCLPESDVVVTVKGGVVDSAHFADTGAPLSEERVRRVPSIDDLFETIRAAYDREAVIVRATYDGTYGFPVDVFIDYDSMIADEEIGYQVRGEISLYAAGASLLG